MERVCRQLERDLIGAAIELLPAPLRNLCEGNRWVQFFTDCDPVFSGVHYHKGYARGNEKFGWSHYVAYENVYPWHNKHSWVGTIVLPDPDAICRNRPTILHEIGHHFHHWLGWEDFGFPEVSSYAQTDGRERFAEAFMCWAMKDIWNHHETLTRDDYAKFRMLLERLPDGARR